MDGTAICVSVADSLLAGFVAATGRPIDVNMVAEAFRPTAAGSIAQDRRHRAGVRYLRLVRDVHRAVAE